MKNHEYRKKVLAEIESGFPERIINLSSILQEVRDGEYSHKKDIIRKFNELQTLLRLYREEVLIIFDEVNTCQHEEFTQPYYQVKRMFLGNYIYDFQKECKNCGKHFSQKDDGNTYNEKNPPEGYEGAQSRYYNNNI